MIIKERDRVQIDSARFGSLYKGTSREFREMLDYIASLQRQIDRITTRIVQLEKKLDDDSK